MKRSGTFHNNTMIIVIMIEIILLFNRILIANTNKPPIIHYSNIMRILKIPYFTEPGTVVYRNIRILSTIFIVSNQTSNGTNSSAHLLILFNLKNRRPRFSTNNCLASIDEHSNFLSSVRWRSSHQVIDYDYGFNGTFELSIIDPNEIFLITPKIGYQNITFTLLINDSRRLDFETTPNISVIINAKDLSNEREDENLTCIVVINDINGNVDYLDVLIFFHKFWPKLIFNA
ncbi:hypothetical protein QR98_0092050 [Sarcoptes scabiei]|uniref:Uncharacterized protein n=1 Tax=Sarcoptes scabiei TaxID=52283 RepID=A0A132AJ86_SARSC|nr:hypothetical protein QR98_0092050 [Sarcoptes scabiei]